MRHKHLIEVVLNIVIWTVLIVSIFFVFIQCSPTSPQQDWGLPWDELIGTTWYVLDGDGTALNEFRFYEDSVVVVIDHFAYSSYSLWDSMQVQHRTVHIGKVMRKDEITEYDSDGFKLDGMYLATELQWKRYAPGMYNPCIWTPVYDWSVYQWWYIYSISDSVLEFGDAPYYYKLTKEKPVKVKYPDGFVPHLCEEGVEIRRTNPL